MTQLTDAAQRLAQSRARIRHGLRAQSATTARDESPFNSAAALAWMAVLHKVPGVDVLRQAAQAWWMQQPVQPAAAASWEALKVALPPMARRHPAALLATAAALGGLIAITRPWRWAFKPALWVALLPQLLGAIVATRAQPPPTPQAD